MPEPSGMPVWGYKSNVTEADFQVASVALDRALLRVIGLPEEVEIREFENAVLEMTAKMKSIIKDFSVSKLIAILPELVLDATELWERVKSKIQGKVERKDFITKVIRYVYRKNDPDLPFLVEPFETMVENMILNAVPDMLDNLEKKLDELFQKLTAIFK